MAIQPFLAMTAGEFPEGSPLPPKIAWMACHFSPYTTGLSNLPKILPSSSLLILNDRTPICGHDPKSVEFQLTDCLALWGCEAVLLDFQRGGIEETEVLVKHLVQTLPCPVAVSDLYAPELDCPVFLPPLPHHMALADYLQPWQNRKIWLEAALDAEVIAVTEDGAEITPCSGRFSGGHPEPRLHCHYKTVVSDTSAVFTLWRTREDLEALLEEAESLGVCCAVGLYQQLHDFPAS